MNIFYFTKYENEHSLQRKITPDKVKKRQSFVVITPVNTNPLCFLCSDKISLK